jgi:hypothetical protein
MNAIPTVRMRSARPAGSLLPPLSQGNDERNPKEGVGEDHGVWAERAPGRLEDQKRGK